MKEIFINSKKHGRYRCLVDDEDYSYLSKHNWFLSKDKKTFYAAAWLKDENGNFVKIKMHQMIMGDYDRKLFIIDHISRDPLDNRRFNLRFVTWAQNARNRGPLTDPKKSCKYKGVRVEKKYGYISIQITHNGIKYNESGFKSVEDAAKRWNELARQYHGEFAYQNII